MYRFPPLNRWPDREAKQYHRGLPQSFCQFRTDNWVRFLPMAKFAYNGIKNASSGHMFFKLNCGYHLKSFYKEDVNPCSQSKLANKLATELRKLITIYIENHQYTQELQKRYHNKHAKLRSYALGKKVWLNRKYIKTKQNCKLEL